MTPWGVGSRGVSFTRELPGGYWKHVLKLSGVLKTRTPRSDLTGAISWGLGQKRERERERERESESERERERERESIWVVASFSGRKSGRDGTATSGTRKAFSEARPT